MISVTGKSCMICGNSDVAPLNIKVDANEATHLSKAYLETLFLDDSNILGFLKTAFYESAIERHNS